MEGRGKGEGKGKEGARLGVGPLCKILDPPLAWAHGVMQIGLSVAEKNGQRPERNDEFT